MNKKLISKEVQEYINANLKADLHSFLLKKSPFEAVSVQEIAQQIKGKQIAEKKFPFLLKEDILFPPHLNLEQASSQSTAEYKSELVIGNSIIDLTSGLGIDAYFLSTNFEKVTLIEQNKELLDLVEHNWTILKRIANFINQQLEDFLETNNQKYDVVYLDPARRDDKKNKVFLLQDLSPNILEIQNKLLEIGKTVIIKLSPLIDLKYLISELPNIYRIDIVGVKNEVKEVLIFLTKDSSHKNLEIKCINLESKESVFTSNFENENNSRAEFSEPLNYLYIPNNSILKAGFFNSIAEKYNTKKLHPNTHLYTSDEKIIDFPGRVLEIAEVNSKDLKKGEQYNIISKNYPLKPEEIKKKYKLKDGGNRYLIFSQTQKGKIILKSV
jgi:16S rRNA G966 N2-methylase RsmD